MTNPEEKAGVTTLECPLPSRLMKVVSGAALWTVAETQHLASCRPCRQRLLRTMATFRDPLSGTTTQPAPMASKPLPVPDLRAPSHLSQIDTLWPVLRQAHDRAPDEINAAQQAMLFRYRPAIYRYLRASLDEEGADEVLQEFALRFVRGDYRNAEPEQSRFRDLLKIALYQLLVEYRKERKRKPAQLSPEAPEPAVSAESTPDSDKQFLAEWRAALLNKAWEALAEEERRTNWPIYTVLHYRASHQEMRSAEMAVQLSEVMGKTVSADWVRKLLHSAREKFAEFLLAEVAGSLREPTPDAVEQELIDLGLYQYCKVALDAYRNDRGESERESKPTEAGQK